MEQNIKDMSLFISSSDLAQKWVLGTSHQDQENSIGIHLRRKKVQF